MKKRVYNTYFFSIERKTVIILFFLDSADLLKSSKKIKINKKRAKRGKKRPFSPPKGLIKYQLFPIRKLFWGKKIKKMSSYNCIIRDPPFFDNFGVFLTPPL